MTPAFVSLLCICIVFVPMFFLDGVARFLFVPMAEAVMFAMVCSFILSRTLVPTMAKYLLKPHCRACRCARQCHRCAGFGSPLAGGPLVRFQRGFEARFIRMRAGYRDLLDARDRPSPRFRQRLPAVRRRLVPADAVCSAATSSPPSTAGRS
mgnify:CR=1 FL=1